MKILLANLMVMFFAFFAFGQNAVENNSQCTNQIVEKISSRGIMLGMSQEETLNIFAENNRLTAVYGESSQNELRIRYSTKEVEYQNVLNFLQNQSAKMFGYSSTVLAPKDKVKFDGISHYDLGFLDNRLTFFRVYYTKPKWENREQFIDKLSLILKLPKVVDYEGEDSLIKCGDYEIRFGENYNDERLYIMSVSANVDEIVRQRRKKVEDEQREKHIKVFKP